MLSKYNNFDVIRFWDFKKIALLQSDVELAARTKQPLPPFFKHYLATS